MSSGSCVLRGPAKARKPPSPLSSVTSVKTGSGAAAGMPRSNRRVIASFSCPGTYCSGARSRCARRPIHTPTAESVTSAMPVMYRRRRRRPRRVCLGRPLGLWVTVSRSLRGRLRGDDPHGGGTAREFHRRGRETGFLAEQVVQKELVDLAVVENGRDGIRVH